MMPATCVPWLLGNCSSAEYFEFDERFDELPIDGATGFRALGQLGQEVARLLRVNRVFEVGLQQLADAAVPLGIGPEVVEADDVSNLGEVEDPFDAACSPFVFKKAGWRVSMPESRTAQVISLQSTLKSVRAASALTAGTERNNAWLARRLSEMVYTSGVLGWRGSSC